MKTIQNELSELASTEKTEVQVEPTWRDLYEFIQKKVEQEGDSFLNNKFYIEMVGEHNDSFKQIECGEGWKYIQPAWFVNKETKSTDPLTTNFTKKKIVTLNINY